jgi:hypothetical protein
MANSGTAVVPYDSILVRNKWMLEGLVQARSTSFWEGLTGATPEAVVYQSVNSNASDGHEVRFQYNGNLSSNGVVGKEQLWGREEEKKLFSDKIRVERIRWGVSNGDSFDGVEVGDLSITQHEDSRAKLADLFIRAKDQMIFDAMQGFLHSEGASHRILPNGKTDIGSLDANDVWGYDFLLDVEDIIKSGKGYSVGSSRRPLEPYTLADGRRMWLLVVDSRVSRDLRKDSNFISIASNADVRGESNRLLKGVIGKIGSFLVIEADTAFGVADPNPGRSKVEIAGLRHVDSTGLFEGQPGYGGAGTVEASRSVILGKNAVQIAFGRMPTYKFQESPDYAITSGSSCEVWMNVQKTVLKSENGDYDEAKVSGFDFGVVVVDSFFKQN